MSDMAHPIIIPKRVEIEMPDGSIFTAYPNAVKEFIIESIVDRDDYFSMSKRIRVTLVLEGNEAEWKINVDVESLPDGFLELEE